jgi:hypothetical protein
VNLTWTAQPVALIINALAAYRLTRLWIDDMLPPLPRIRKWIDKRTGWWSLIYGKLRRFDRRHPGDLTDAEQAQRDQLIDQAKRRIALYQGEPAAGYLLTCYWCTGFWIGLGVFLAASLLPGILWTILAVPLALSATTGLIAGRAKGNGS